MDTLCVMKIQTIIFGSMLVLIVILPFNEGGNGYIVQLLTQLILLGGAACWAVHALRRGQVGLIFDRVDWFVLGLSLWALGSLAFSAYKYATILELIKLLAYLALFYLARILFPLGEKRALLLAAILGSSLLQLAVALHAVLFRDAPILQAGFVNPNELACFFVFGSAIALSYLLFHQKSAKMNFCTFCVAVALGGLIIALLALKSRGAVIGFSSAGLLLTTLRHKRCGLIFLLCLSVLAVLPLPNGSLLQRLRKQDDPFAYQRLDIWRSSVQMLADHPLYGVGLGMFRYYAPGYNFPVEHQVARYGKRLDLAHGDFLQIGAETGVIGLSLFLAGIGLIGAYSAAQLKTAPISWTTAASAAGILSVLAQSAFSNLLLSPAIAMTTVVFAVILLDGAGKYHHVNHSFATARRSLWQGYFALALLCLYLLVPVIGYPFLGHWYFLQYRQLWQMKAYPQAIAHLQTALQFIPLHASYHQTLGNIYLAAFRNQPNLDAFYEGYQELTQAIRHNPLELEFYVSLAELHREMFRKMLPTRPTAQNAMDEYQRAIQVNPFNPFIRFSLATLYADLNEFEQALTALREAVNLEPNFVGGYQMSGKILTHLQRPQEAAAAFQRAEAIAKQYRANASDTEYVKSLLRSLQ